MKKKTQTISINLPESWVALLREKSHEISLETGKNLCYTDLIRSAIGEIYPEARAAEMDEESA